MNLAIRCSWYGVNDEPLHRMPDSLKRGSDTDEPTDLTSPDHDPETGEVPILSACDPYEAHRPALPNISLTGTASLPRFVAGLTPAQLEVISSSIAGLAEHLQTLDTAAWVELLRAVAQRSPTAYLLFRSSLADLLSRATTAISLVSGGTRSLTASALHELVVEYMQNWVAHAEELTVLLHISYVTKLGLSENVVAEIASDNHLPPILRRAALASVTVIDDPPCVRVPLEQWTRFLSDLPEATPLVVSHLACVAPLESLRLLAAVTEGGGLPRESLYHPAQKALRYLERRHASEITNIIEGGTPWACRILSDVFDQPEFVSRFGCGAHEV